MVLLQVVDMEVDPQCPLSDLQASVEKRTGVLAEQQRMLVVGASGFSHSILVT